MPKSKKQIKATEDKKNTWRTPVKLPTIVTTDEPMKSLYNSVVEPSVNLPDKNITKLAVSENLTDESLPEQVKKSLEKSVLSNSTNDGESSKVSLTTLTTRKTETDKITVPGKPAEKDTKFGEVEFLRLLRTERMDFYSLAESCAGQVWLYIAYYTPIVWRRARIAVRYAKVN